MVRFDRADDVRLSEYLDEAGTLVWFEQEVLIDGPDLLIELEREQSAIDRDRLVFLDWDGSNRRESMGTTTRMRAPFRPELLSTSETWKTGASSSTTTAPARSSTWWP